VQLQLLKPRVSTVTLLHHSRVSIKIETTARKVRRLVAYKILRKYKTQQNVTTVCQVH